MSKIKEILKTELEYRKGIITEREMKVKCFQIFYRWMLDNIRVDLITVFEVEFNNWVRDTRIAVDEANDGEEREIPEIACL